jgi:hypothetical protein
MLTIKQAGHPDRQVNPSANFSDFVGHAFPGAGNERFSVGGILAGGSFTMQCDLVELGEGGYQYFNQTDSGGNYGRWDLSVDGGKTWQRFEPNVQQSSPRIRTQKYGIQPYIEGPTALLRYTSQNGGTVGLANFVHKGPGAA